MRTALEWERERNEINTGNLWRSPCPNKRVRLPRLLTRAKDFSRTADTTNARERGNEMNKVIIEVKGGVAWVAQQPENIEVEIIDYDNLGAGV
jgi:hypothetical protein